MRSSVKPFWLLLFASKDETGTFVKTGGARVDAIFRYFTAQIARQGCY